MAILNNLCKFWRYVRRVSGDDAYERYLQQYGEHGHEEAPLSREEFFKQWQDNKWKGVKRCC